MAGISLVTKGFDQFQKKIAALPDKVKREIDAELKDGANGMRNDMIYNAPADEGFLRNEIQKPVQVPFGYSVVSNAKYSAYVEFGTGSKVSVPSDFNDFAAQFQGKGDSTGSFYEAIKEWVKRKGIDEKAAWPIMRSILLHGINPHPFFIPAFVRWEQLIKNKLEKILADNL